MQCAMAFIGGSPYCWKVSRQTSTTLSSCEAEWFGQTVGTMMLLVHKPIFDFMNIKLRLPIISFCDNTSAIAHSEADGSTKRLKHVLTRMAFLQEQIRDGLVTLVHIATEGMIADIGTKALPAPAFHRFREFLVRNDD